MIISFSLIFSAINLLDNMFYFWYASFPEDRTFIESQKSLAKNTFKRILANIQWLLVFFLIICYGSYIGLVLIWLLLGAIINPNNFLVYASASLTLLTFVSSKYHAFKALSEDGFRAVRETVKKYMQKQVYNKKIFLRMDNSINRG